LVSTAEVFERLVIPSTSASAFDFRGGTTEELFRALATCRNDLQTPAIETAPEIAAVLGTLERQEGCRLARMSGSGGTCFGLFETAAAAEASARQMQASQPGWWIYPTTVDD
jgi:4-diphosphocytidyl-2-C-methyl-D-erythritol kinase